MKKYLLLPLCFFLLSCEKLPFLKEKSVPIQTEEEKISYMLGYILAENTKKSESLLNPEAFLQGVKDNIKNKDPVLSEEDKTAVKNKIKRKAELKEKKEQEEHHKMESQNFLEENKKREEVKTTESGLQYEILEEGKGANPKLTDQVEVHYKGTLIDGSEFDSSYKREKTAKFPLNAVIKGWQEGLQIMKEGAKYKFYIPAELGYGSQGAGAKIPPHSTLIFEVELIKVN